LSDEESGVMSEFVNLVKQTLDRVIINFYSANKSEAYAAPEVTYGHRLNQQFVSLFFVACALNHSGEKSYGQWKS
jgi:hypothetical protein